MTGDHVKLLYRRVKNVFTSVIGFSLQCSTGHTKIQLE